MVAHALAMVSDIALLGSVSGMAQEGVGYPHEPLREN
jgi:hypothetical protein